METQDFGVDERIGSYLRRMREAHGLELEQLSKSIRLGKNVIQAIEDNQWDSFPTEAYLRSYIASICDKLSLDKQEVLKKFSSDTNSHFAVTQANIMSGKNEQAQEPSADNTSKIIVVIILALLAIAIFAFKTLSENSNEPVLEAAPFGDEEQEVSDEAEDTLGLLAQNDSVLALQAAEAEDAQFRPAKDPNAKDTLRFECAPAATDPTCGINLKGLDAKMIYFRNYMYRYITHKDTSHITITVPERTKLLMNGSKLEYGKFNTLLFSEGKIISKSNRELK